MFRRIELEDFKAFHHLSIRVAPLTLLVGENNSGKSSVLAALKLLAQTLESEDKRIPLVLNGPYGDFGAFRDVVHGHHRGRPMRVGVTVDGLQSGSSPSSRPTFAIDLEFKHRMKRRETILRSVRMKRNGRPLLAVAAPIEGGSHLLTEIRGWTVPDSARSVTRRESLRMTNYLPRLVEQHLDRPTESATILEVRERVADARSAARNAYRALGQTLQNVTFLGAMRSPPERTYVHSGVAGRGVRPDGSGWANVLALDEGKRRPESEIVQAWVRNAGIAERIGVEWISDRHYEITVSHPESGEVSNVADVGQGTSQVLPVLVAASQLRSRETFVVEEPEIHLHPRAQAALADVFVELALNGNQCFVETHSEYLILRVQQAVAHGRLSPSDVIIHYVGAMGEEKVVTPVSLDSNGVLEDVLPNGFFPQRLEEARRLASLRRQSSLFGDE